MSPAILIALLAVAIALMGVFIATNAAKATRDPKGSGGEAGVHGDSSGESGSGDCGGGDGGGCD
jgi:hypothetical protein